MENLLAASQKDWAFDKLEEKVSKWKGMRASKHTLTVIAGKETHEALRKLAEAQGRDASELSAEILQNYVKEQRINGPA